MNDVKLSCFIVLDSGRPFVRFSEYTWNSKQLEEVKTRKLQSDRRENSEFTKTK